MESPSDDQPRDDAGVPAGTGNVPRDDVVWKIDDWHDDDEPVMLQPIDPETEWFRRQIQERERERQRVRRDPDPPPRPPQFSIRHLLIFNTLIAVCLALLQIFIPSSVAGVLGVATIVLGLATVKLRDTWPIVERVWWVLLALYLLACVAAVLGG